MEKKTNYGVMDSSKVFLWAVFLPQILSIVLIMVLAIFFKDVKELETSLAYAICMMLVAQIAFALIYFVHNKKNKFEFKIASSLDFNIKAKNVVFCVIISIIAVFGFSNFVAIFNSIFASWGYVAPASLIPNNTFGYFVLNVLISAILPAIFEELLFRGIVFNGLKGRGFWFAAIISSVMFMFVHLSIGSLIYPILMGIVFCLVVKKTGNILYSIIIHFCNNFIVLLIEYLNNATGSSIWSFAISDWWQYMLVVLGALVAFIAIYLTIKYLIIGKNIEVGEQANVTENNQITPETITEKTNQIFKTRKENIYLYSSLIIVFIFWLVMVVLSF